MLPPHREGDFELIPPSGLRVSEVVSKSGSASPSSRLQAKDRGCVARSVVPQFSLAPRRWTIPAYSDYRDLVKRGYKGLTHLDGLHRLIAWASVGVIRYHSLRSGIVGP